jgi:hypothetical protein
MLAPFPFGINCVRFLKPLDVAQAVPDGYSGGIATYYRIRCGWAKFWAYKDAQGHPLLFYKDIDGIQHGVYPGGNDYRDEQGTVWVYAHDDGHGNDVLANAKEPFRFGTN